MAGAVGSRMTVADSGWPWERPVARTGVLTAVRELLGRVWSLATLTLVVVAGGYAWLGLLVGGISGALAGAVFGLATAGVLHVLADRAVSGRH
ncbi:hypothetical protein [Streptomyces sp. NPDC090080]|uniref:hypothetical protein n=1 Tax=Streptomyces sp. NPDC090080 TaxID=3365939 RepID=UPI0037F20D8F